MSCCTIAHRIHTHTTKLTYPSYTCTYASEIFICQLLKSKRNFQLRLEPFEFFTFSNLPCSINNVQLLALLFHRYSVYMFFYFRTPIIVWRPQIKAFWLKARSTFQYRHEQRFVWRFNCDTKIRLQLWLVERRKFQSKAIYRRRSLSRIYFEF